MLLTIDIGNSNIVTGVFDNEKLIEVKRFQTEKHQSKLDYFNAFSHQSRFDITSIVIASVVPEITSLVINICKEFFTTKPLIMTPNKTTGISNISDNCEIGADRLANMIALHTLYPGNAIAIDVGTATTYEILLEKKVYLGGAIGPGIGSSFDVLIQQASLLKKIKLASPKKIITLGTENQLNVGYVLGFATMIDGMIDIFLKDLQWKDYKLILTGGFSDLISPHIVHKCILDKNLTLQGLQIFWKLNYK